MNYLTPDWLIFGFRSSDGVYGVYASDELNMAELKTIMRAPSFLLGDDPFAMPEVRHIECRAEMRRFVMTQGESYKDALAKLFGQWKPDADTKALPEGPRGINS